MTRTRIRIGFKSRRQAPWIMIWREWYTIEVEHAAVIWKLWPFAPKQDAQP